MTRDLARLLLQGVPTTCHTPTHHYPPLLTTTNSLPPHLFSKADPERMRTAIAAARGAGVAEATVADAEDKMARVLEREEEDRVRLVRVRARG